MIVITQPGSNVVIAIGNSYQPTSDQNTALVDGISIGLPPGANKHSVDAIPAGVEAHKYRYDPVFGFSEIGKQPALVSDERVRAVEDALLAMLLSGGVA